MELIEVQLLSNDLKATEDFYKDKLGLKLRHKDQKTVSFYAGQSILIFKYSAIHNPVYHFAFNIPSNKIEEASNWLSKIVDLIKVDDKAIIDFKNWNAKAVYFFDNNKNIVECIARFDLKNDTDVMFGPSSFLALSEIGVVTGNVKGLFENLTEHYHLSEFYRQPFMSNFAAVGDDKGLLILSEQGRHWYPTQITAMPYYSKILIRNNRIESTIEVNS